MATLFTRIVNGEIPCHKVAEDDRFLAFLDIMPLRKGHVLVIPKTEVDYIFDMEDELLALADDQDVAGRLHLLQNITSFVDRLQRAVH